RKILELGQSVAHRQNRLGIIDVNAGRELERRDGGRIHVDQSERRMIGHHVAAAFLAVLPLAYRRLLIHADMLGTGRDLHGLGFPERERIYRSRRPRAARTAMTITHAFRLAGDLDMHRTAKTFALVCRHRRLLGVARMYACPASAPVLE